MSTTTTRGPAGRTRAPAAPPRSPLERVADLVDRYVAPQPARRARVTPVSVGVVAAVGIAGVALALLRHGPFVWSTLWAEDGAVFLTEALRLSTFEALVEPYAGYLHVVPRAVGEVATVVGVTRAAQVFALAGAGLAVLAGLVVYAASAGHVRERFLRGVLAVTVMLVPTAGVEAPNSVAYAQWYLLAAAVWLVLWRPRGLATAALGGLFLATVAMSAPLTVVLAPIVGVRLLHAWIRRDACSALLAAGAVLGMAAQAAAILLFPDTGSVASEPGNLAQAGLLRVVGGVVPGVEVTRSLWPVLDAGTYAVLGVVLAAMVAVVAIRSDRRVRLFGAWALITGVAVLLLADVTRGTIGTLVWPTDLTEDISARYTIVPVVLVVSALLVRADHAIRRSGAMGAARPVWALALAGVLLLDVGMGYEVGRDERFDTSWPAALAEAAEDCEARPADADVQIPISPGGWAVEARCADLPA